MIKLRTANNELFTIAWIGVANIDGVLRFAVLDSDIQTIVGTFTNQSNCVKLTRIFDNDEEFFEGYTIFRGIQITYDDSIIVSMSKI